MATKLKDLHLTSVDLVRAGANQEADICLFKSADGLEATEQPTAGEKNIFKRFLKWLREEPTAALPELHTNIEKDFSSFDSINAHRENDEKLWRYSDALTQSIRSIQDDNDLSADQKLQMMKQSLGEFDAAMAALFESLCCTGINQPKVIGKSDADRFDEIEEIQKYNLNHDPATGRFISGSATGGISSRTVANGGISVHVKSGKEPKTGYMVAVYGERSQWLKGDDVADPGKREAAIKSFMDKNKDVLSDPDNYLGTWFDTSTGNISLDISKNFSDKNKAINFASEHNEKAIWDVENMAEISTGGTGNNL